MIYEENVRKGKRWMPVYGFEDKYTVCEDGRIWSRRNQIILKNRPNKGYLCVSLGISRDCRSNVSIHRIVAKAFIPNPENKPTVNHKDGNKLNNCVENLEWATIKEQQQHAVKIGITDNAGDNNNNRKLDSIVVDEIRLRANKLGEHGRSIWADLLSRGYIVKYCCIWRVITFKSWNHINSTKTNRNELF